MNELSGDHPEDGRGRYGEAVPGLRGPDPTFSLLPCTMFAAAAMTSSSVSVIANALQPRRAAS